MNSTPCLFRQQISVRRLLLVLLLACTATVCLKVIRPVHAATTFTVNSTADTNDGSCAPVGTGNGCTLREAIIAANVNSDADIINFSVSGTITVGSTLPRIREDLTIDGSGQNIILDGAQQHTILYADGRFSSEFGIDNELNLSLKHLTISNGAADRCESSTCDGGGIWSASETLNITDCTFTNNSAPNSGGAVAENGGTLTITNSTFSNNTAPNGGAVCAGVCAIMPQVLPSFAFITGSTFLSNTATRSGGGIYCLGSLTVQGSTFSTNTSGIEGAGIYSNSFTFFPIFPTPFGSLNVAHSSFSNNSTFDPSQPTEGGGISAGELPAVVQNCSFSGNSAVFGGGIAESYGTLSVTDSTFTNNSGSGGGGGIFTTGKTTVNGSKFSGNTAAVGGAIVNSNNPLLPARGPYTLNVANSTFSGNSASSSPGSGGAINNLGDAVSVTNCTFSGNTATASSGPANGGAISNFLLFGNSPVLSVTNSTLSGNSASGAGTNQGGAIMNAGGTVNARNTIIANNTATNGPDVFGALTSQGHNLFGNTSDATITGDTTGNILNQNPQLGPLANNGGPTLTMALLPGSPAFDAGDDCVFDNSCSPALASALTTDQRGGSFSRKVSAHVDIGAYEVNGVLQTGSPSFLVNTTADTFDGACTAEPGGCTLREAISVANTVAGANTISFDPALFLGGAATITLTGALPDLSSDININGPGANLLTVSGNQVTRVFNVASGMTVGLNGLTIANGNVSSGSGGIGGGIFNAGTLTITNCALSGNSVSGGTAGLGGPSNFGGGILNSGTLTLTNSTLSANSASGGFNSSGGGIYNGGTVMLVNSTLSGNSANAAPITFGGAVFNHGGTVTLINSTLSANSGSIGGIFNNSGTVNAGNTIIAQNTSADFVGTLTSQGHNLIGNTSGTTITGDTTGNILNQDPLLDALQNNGGPTFTHALLYNSPAVDKGDNTVTGAPLNLTTDQRGLARNVDGDLVAGAVVDIGAYERQDPESRPVASGSNVNIDLNDVQLSFPNVSAGGGTATIEVLDPDAQGAPPGGFSIGTHPQPAGCAANPSQSDCLPAFNVSTTATYTGPVGICFYLPAITDESFFNGLKILHSEAGVLVNRTTGQNFASKIVCGSVTTLSPFVIGHSATPTSANGDISGQITDANGKPVEGAVVWLSGAQTRKTITDAKGRYYFDNIAANGFYTVTPERTNYGFNPANRSFNQLGNHTEAGFAGSFNGDNTNPLDTPEYFVRQQYVDLLGREPDEGGFNYWSDELLRCGSNATCVQARRIDIAAAFFIEQEFQQSGAFIHNLYKGSLGRKPAYGEYEADRRQVVGGPTLNADKVAFAGSFVQRAEFVQKYQANTTPESFVDALLEQIWESSKVDLAGDRSLLLAIYQTGSNMNQSRSLVLQHVIATPAFKQAEYNPAFVLTEYFGYLRRNPEPEGYDFWLNVLNNSEPRNYRGMVCSFITSTEYQKRFSSVVTHSNAECGR